MRKLAIEMNTPLGKVSDLGGKLRENVAGPFTQIFMNMEYTNMEWFCVNLIYYSFIKRRCL
jgi:hypothetical protein